MAKDSIVPTQGIRERHLNIVYFVDSSKSHSIRINLTAARWMMAGSIGIVLWSILSLGWIISLGRVLDSTRSQLGAALSSIFDYQVKYDRVFEQAYPDNSTVGYYASGSHLPKNNPTAADTNLKTVNHAKPEVTAKVATPATKEASATSTDANNDVAVTSTANISDAAATNGSDVDIKNFSLTAQNGKMTLLFDILNKDPKVRAEGYIWTVGTLQTADGTTKRFVGPSHAKLNADGQVEVFSSTYKFSIQRFKRKEFIFDVPKDQNWKLTELKISHVNAQGKQLQNVAADTNVKFLTGSSTTSSTAKTSVQATQSEESGEENSENTNEETAH